MKEVYVEGFTLPNAYHNALLALDKLGEDTDCADWNCNQKELSMTFHVEYPTLEPRISRCFFGGPKDLQQYCMELLDGILDFEIEAGKWTYTYHDRIKDQIPFVIEELRRNPSSRRAVIDVRTPEDMGNNDPACLQHIQYFIRDNALHCKVLFRSNDACKATFMNAFGLILLQERIAQELGVDVGTYTHRANSFHCYEKDYGMLHGYCNRIRHHKDSVYNYDPDWKELMEDEIENINKEVEVLKTYV